MKSADLAKKLKVSPGLVSDIINYKKRFSKEVIRQLASAFKLSQEAFNRPYKLKSTGHIDLEEYNEDIDEAMAEVARGESYSHEEVVKMSL